MKTKVILRQDIPALGHVGDTVEVSAGYARNFLLPREMAYPWSSDATLRVEKDRVIAQEKRDALEAEFSQLTQRVGDVQLTYEEMVSLEGHLYGSVNAHRIAETLQEQGLNIEERNVRLPEPIRVAGEYEVPIHIHGDLETKIKVWVVAVQDPDAVALEEEADESEESSSEGPEEAPAEA
ncbi:MAG: 50S ribosomal protein L9 [Planctomycetota bacterium]|jgi:large subunit ribosomal protein L9|nr:50S ribosomal protein L9 [Planctomycetota bacterium]MDP6940421.1 50S ribosomal protein L9 [Planctomycetota bacterium]